MAVFAQAGSDHLGQTVPVCSQAGRLDPQPLVAKFVVLTFARARHRLGHAGKVNHCSASQGGEIRILRLADY